MYILLKNKFLRREDWSVSPPCHWSLAGVVRLSYAVLARVTPLVTCHVSRVTAAHQPCPWRPVVTHWADGGGGTSHTAQHDAWHSGVLGWGHCMALGRGHCHCVQVNRLSESRSALMLELLMRLESRLECDRLMVAVSYSPGLPPYTLDPVFSRDLLSVPEVERSVPE